MKSVVQQFDGKFHIRNIVAWKMYNIEFKTGLKLPYVI